MPSLGDDTPGLLGLLLVWTSSKDSLVHKQKLLPTLGTSFELAMLPGTSFWNGEV